MHASKVSCNMRSCLRFFPPFSLKLKKLYFNHHLELLLWNLFKGPLTSIMGTGSWKKLENNTSCLQLQTKIMAGIIVQWSPLLLGVSTNCWSRSCSLSLLTLLPGHYSVTDDFETTTVLIFLQGEIIISISSLNAIQQISAALHIGEWSCKLLERGETGKLAPQLEMSTFFHRLAHLVFA